MPLAIWTQSEMMNTGSTMHGNPCNRSSESLYSAFYITIAAEPYDQGRVIELEKSLYALKCFFNSLVTPASTGAS